MRTFSLHNPIRVLLLISLAALALVAGTGAARASNSDQRVASDLSGPATDGCRGLTGTESGTLYSHFEFRQTANGALHFLDSDHGTYRVDWEDGSYSLGSIDHSFTSVFGIAGEQPQPEIFMDKSTVYDADGNRLGTEFGKFLEHVSIDNQPPLFGPPGPEDTLHVQIDTGTFTCSV
jgi:hypothetical protein